MGGVVPRGKMRGRAKERVRKLVEGCGEGQGQVDDVTEVQDKLSPLQLLSPLQGSP